ncbi:hypothetical protein EDWATA_02667 [Edwardsiella tarda ATCC 23685]|uniref:Uncharacterized protein n=1 Tax=Edwardsiella tarda ATCC 23685 TaxID=500638 RepID=D4F7D1_EDWTA|nr:hypothetical protein EDWATA_02667 [Edwardsiella tarda ATCC 23685]
MSGVHSVSKLNTCVLIGLFTPWANRRSIRELSELIIPNEKTKKV